MRERISWHRCEHNQTYFHVTALLKYTRTFCSSPLTDSNMIPADWSFPPSLHLLDVGTSKLDLEFKCSSCSGFLYICSFMKPSENEMGKNLGQNKYQFLELNNIFCDILSQWPPIHQPLKMLWHHFLTLWMLRTFLIIKSPESWSVFKIWREPVTFGINSSSSHLSRNKTRKV